MNFVMPAGHVLPDVSADRTWGVQTIIEDIRPTGAEIVSMHAP
jgi:hypothetical protein